MLGGQRRKQTHLYIVRVALYVDEGKRNWY